MMFIKPSVNMEKGSDETFRILAEKTNDAIIIMREGRRLYYNPKYLELTGYREPAEIADKPPLSLVHPDDREMVMEYARRRMEDGSVPSKYEFRGIRADGSIIWIEISSSLIDYEGQPASLGYMRDITERKLAEEALQESEEKYRTFFKTSRDCVFITFKDGSWIDFNDAAVQFFGYESRDELRKVRIQNLYLNKQDRKRHTQEITQQGFCQDYAVDLRKKDGSIIHTLITSVTKKDKNGEVIGYQGTIKDITDQRRADEALKGALNFMQQLIDAMPVPVFYKDRDGRYLGCNKAFEQFFGKKREEITGKSVYDVSPKEHADIYRKQDMTLLHSQGIQMEKSWLEVNDRLSAILGYSWQELKDMTWSELTHPDDLAADVEQFDRILAGEIDSYMMDKRFIRKDGEVIWASLAVGCARKQDGTVDYFVALFQDITARKESVERIRKTLGATVHAIAVTAETKDPYTGGHQRRVADLASSIAAEMGLATNQIEGIRTAAIIHDMGKISVPAEILSKPSRLTDIEFSLIKTHAQAGHDFLKDIEFPWPVARMVLEHHERMDGSGYPNGLTGDKLLMESKILVVADVVEAMASHRPYRPGLGLHSALDEILKNKGTFYDPEVVDACLKLFKEDGYTLPD